MYKLRFWFEHGGTCLWSKNDVACEKYGYAVDFHDLPISCHLANELAALENEYRTILDWAEPQNPLLWDAEKKQDFVNRAISVYHQLEAELSNDYLLQNDVVSCVYFD